MHVGTKEEELRKQAIQCCTNQCDADNMILLRQQLTSYGKRGRVRRRRGDEKR